MVHKLEERGLDLVSDGSIYPLLSRLQKQNLVEGYYEGSSGGPQRKYYRICKEGEERLRHWQEEWERLEQGVDAVLRGGKR